MALTLQYKLVLFFICELKKKIATVLRQFYVSIQFNESFFKSNRSKTYLQVAHIPR